MKVFLDTNVWLSARFRPGLCAQLLDALLEAGLIPLLDERVVEEFQRIAAGKLKVEAALLSRTMDFFHRYATVLPAATVPADNVPDPDDAWIVAAALAAGADWFVTGDRALLNLGFAKSTRFISPRTAYEQLCAAG